MESPDVDRRHPAEALTAVLLQAMVFKEADIPKLFCSTAILLGQPHPNVAQAAMASITPWKQRAKGTDKETFAEDYFSSLAINQGVEVETSEWLAAVAYSFPRACAHLQAVKACAGTKVMKHAQCMI